MLVKHWVGPALQRYVTLDDCLAEAMVTLFRTQLLELTMQIKHHSRHRKFSRQTR